MTAALAIGLVFAASIIGVALADRAEQRRPRDTRWDDLPPRRPVRRAHEVPDYVKEEEE